MGALTPQQKQAIDQALDFLDRIRACYEALPQNSRHTPPEKLREIRELAENLRRLNRDGLIDWESNSFGIVAETDRNGIHLNPGFGGDYGNDYQFPDDYRTDDCEEGYFYSLWRLLEILIHEKYHYENHTGPVGSLNKALAALSYATVGNAIELLSKLSGAKRRIRRKYMGHEHQAYSYTASVLFWIDSLLFWACLEGNPDCIACCNRHAAQIKGARARQEPYDFG